MIAAEVYLWGTRIGYVAQESVSDIAKFNYDLNFIRSGIEQNICIVMRHMDRWF